MVVATWGGHLISDDGTSNWRLAPQPAACDDTIRWTDGTGFHPKRRERPWFLIENGNITWLFTAVFDGTKPWNQPVPLVTPISLDRK